MATQDLSTQLRGRIRACVDTDRPEMLRIVNAAAEAYRGKIPADCWHEPYMTGRELTDDMARGVAFSGFETSEGLVGIMGLQRRSNIDLIRHAYVVPACQGKGLGAALLAHLCRASTRPILIGTWRAADWAIRFYERHGFARVPEDDTAALLRAYWTVPDRQIATSVVLSTPPLRVDEAAVLIEYLKASDASGSATSAPLAGPNR